MDFVIKKAFYYIEQLRIVFLITRNRVRNAGQMRENWLYYN